MLNGIPLVDLPQLSSCGPPGYQVFAAAPVNPSEVTLQTTIANSSVESPPQENPFSENAIKEALHNYQALPRPIYQSPTTPR